MADLNYSDYLELDALLSAQNPRTPPGTERSVVIAEHFFIITHQSCELWLKQLALDLDAAGNALAAAHSAADAEDCVEFLERSVEILRILNEQLVVLGTLPIRHFAAFRQYLGTASGAQSSQFHGIGRLLGDGKNPVRLYDEFAAAAQRGGMPLAEVCRRGPAAGVYHRIAETLLDIGSRYWSWKVGHVALVSKMLGDRQGTAGTTGADYLLSRIAMPFAELRQLRGELHMTVNPSPPMREPAAL